MIASCRQHYKSSSRIIQEYSHLKFVLIYLSRLSDFSLELSVHNLPEYQASAYYLFPIASFSYWKCATCL